MWVKHSPGCLMKTISMETFSFLARGKILIFSKSLFLWVIGRTRYIQFVFLTILYFFFFKAKTPLGLFYFMFNKIGNGLVQAFLRLSGFSFCDCEGKEYCLTDLPNFVRYHFV